MQKCFYTQEEFYSIRLKNIQEKNQQLTTYNKSLAVKVEKGKLFPTMVTSVQFSSHHNLFSQRTEKQKNKNKHAFLLL